MQVCRITSAKVCIRLINIHTSTSLIDVVFGSESEMLTNLQTVITELNKIMLSMATLQLILLAYKVLHTIFHQKIKY